MSKITEIATNILKKELLGLEVIYSLIENQSFTDAIELLKKTKGKIIVTGIGKSGHIGAKISATLSSTGSPSVYVHPSEASHGDLGVIQKEDTIMFLSNSGETQEMKDVVMFAKKNGIPSVAIVGSGDSFIGNNANVVINFGKLDEAMSSIPAPTTSTTVTLVIGDIIAGCLSEVKNFDRLKYNNVHPGGSLGKSLMHVGDVVDKNHVPLVNIDATMKDVIMEITSKRYGIAIISDNSGNIVGVVSDGDIRRHMSDHLLTEKISDVMTKNPKRIYSDMFVVDAIEMMTENKILTVLVVDRKDNLVGVLQLYDLIK